MKFNIITLGCKVNSYESNYISESLVNNGFSFCDNLSECDVVVINTCTVTDTADKKSLKIVRRVRRENPTCLLCVIGCSTQNDPSKYDDLNINILLGTKDKNKLPELIMNYKEDYSFVNEKREIVFEDMMINNFDHVRAYIKIQDGCDNFCSYCIIPFVRGSVRFKQYDKIIEESKSLVEKGFKEIVLTGIHTGSWHYEDKDLTDLIISMSEIEGLERIRLSSVEITELNDKFLDMLKTNKKFCNHLHVPLQAGSDEILKIMNRKYDLDYYRNKIKAIRDIIPDISITTDVIVGHNYETDELFEKTLDFCEEINFAKIHVFPYSKRTGTAASKMDGEIKEDVKKKRVRRLMGLSAIMEQRYYDSFKGSKMDVLVETCKDGISYGHTSNYLMVKINGEREVGQIYNEEI